MDHIGDVIIIAASAIIFCSGVAVLNNQSRDVRNMASALVYSIEDHETVNMTGEKPKIILEE